MNIKKLTIDVYGYQEQRVKHYDAYNVTTESWMLEPLPNGQKCRCTVEATLENGVITTAEASFTTMPYVGPDIVDYFENNLYLRADSDFNPESVGIASCGILLNDGWAEVPARHEYPYEQFCRNGVNIPLQYGIDYTYQYFVVDTMGREMIFDTIYDARVSAPPQINSYSAFQIEQNTIECQYDIAFNGAALNDAKIYVVRYDGTGTEWVFNVSDAHSMILRNGMADSKGKTLNLEDETNYEVMLAINGRESNASAVQFVFINNSNFD